MPKRATTITSDFSSLQPHLTMSRLVVYGEGKIVDFVRKNRLFVHSSGSTI